MTLNQAELTLIDSSIDHQLALMRLSAGERKKVFALLEQLRIELKNKLNNDLTSFQKTRVNKLLKQTDKIIQSSYVEMSGSIDKLALSKFEVKNTAAMLELIGIDASLPTASVIKSLSADSLLEGLPLNDWWSRQSDGLKRSFSSQVRLGILSNETQQQIITRVFGSPKKGIPGVGFPEKTLRRNASTMVHDTIAQVTNDARMAVYRENEDIAKGYYQLSTLDSHTSKTCIAYAGAEWDLDFQPIAPNELPYDGGTPRHPNCRSLILMILKSYKELGYPNIKEPPPATRASDEGQIKADTTFDAYLKRKTVKEQDAQLGKGRAQLWRDGKITLSDLVDGTGRELTLKELISQSGGSVKAPAVTRAKPFTPKTSIADVLTPRESPGVVNFKGITKANEAAILQGLNDSVVKYDGVLYNVGWQVRRRKSLAIASRDGEWIQFQKTGSSKINKEASKDKEIYLKNKAANIAKTKAAIADPKRSRIIESNKARLLTLESSPRWGAYMDSENPLATIAAHEGFHNVYNTHGLKNTWTKALDKRGLSSDKFFSVSEYAGTNVSELFAEVGASISSNVKIPKPFIDAFDETIGTIGGKKT